MRQGQRSTPGPRRYSIPVEFFSEEALRTAVFVLVRIVEAAGAIIIFVGAVAGFGLFLNNLVRRQIQ